MRKPTATPLSPGTIGSLAKGLRILNLLAERQPLAVPGRGRDGESPRRACRRLRSSARARRQQVPSPLDSSIA